jgi:hypothetical protein
MRTQSKARASRVLGFIVLTDIPDSLVIVQRDYILKSTDFVP